MRKVYGIGRGGKHGPSPDARRWRELVTHIASNIRAAHPKMYAPIAVDHAESEARRVTWALNRRERKQMEELWASAVDKRVN